MHPPKPHTHNFTPQEFRAAGRAALSDQARNDEALREDATRAIDQLRALNSLDS
jgi:ribosomal protein L4